MNPQGKLPVLVLGGSGQLGCLIIKELLNFPEISVSVLVHQNSKCEEFSDKIKSSGGKIFNGDVTNISSIEGITKGIHTVISTLEGDEKVMFHGQMNVLKDGIKNGIQRFVPSEFTLNVWKLPTGTNYVVDQMLKFREQLKKENVKSLHFTTGIFMETYFTIVDKDGFWYWNDPNKRIDLISIEDVARFVAYAVKDPNLSGDVYVSSVQMPIKQIHEIYTQITGKSLELKNMGSVSDLKECIKKCKEDGNLYNALKFGYYYLIFGENTLIPDLMNQNFPNVKPLSLEQFLDKTKGKPLTELPLFEITKNVPKETLLNYAV